MDAVDHAHYKEEQRAYYQGFVDSVQVLDGLGIIKKRMRINSRYIKEIENHGNVPSIEKLGQLIRALHYKKAYADKGAS